MLIEYARAHTHAKSTAAAVAAKIRDQRSTTSVRGTRSNVDIAGLESNYSGVKAERARATQEKLDLLSIRVCYIIIQINVGG